MTLITTLFELPDINHYTRPRIKWCAISQVGL